MEYRIQCKTSVMSPLQGLRLACPKMLESSLGLFRGRCNVLWSYTSPHRPAESFPTNKTPSSEGTLRVQRNLNQESSLRPQLKSGQGLDSITKPWQVYAHVNMTTLKPSSWNALTTSGTELLKKRQSSARNANWAPLLTVTRVPSCATRAQGIAHMRGHSVT